MHSYTEDSVASFILFTQAIVYKFHVKATLLIAKRLAPVGFASDPIRILYRGHRRQRTAPLDRPIYNIGNPGLDHHYGMKCGKKQFTIL